MAAHAKNPWEIINSLALTGTSSFGLLFLGYSSGYLLLPVGSSFIWRTMGILTVVRANVVQSSGLDVLGAGLASNQQQEAMAHEIQQTTRELESLVSNRSKSELAIRLELGSWSVTECLDHLTQTTRAFLPAISAATAAAPQLRNNRRLRTGFLTSLFIRNLNPPYRFRFKVLAQLAPQNSASDTAWASFVESQSELLAILSSTAGLAIDEVTIKSPVYGRISYNIYGALRMLVAHQRRHLWQISQILKAVDSRFTRGVA